MRAYFIVVLIALLPIGSRPAQAEEPERITALIATYEYDTNVLQAPESAENVPSARSDSSYMTFLYQEYAPKVLRGIRLKAFVLWKDYFELNELDMLALSGGLERKLALGPLETLLDYDANTYRLGGDPYLVIHSFGAEIGLKGKTAVQTSLRYEAGLKSFVADENRELGGTGHSLELELLTKKIPGLRVLRWRTEAFREDVKVGRSDYIGGRTRLRLERNLPLELRLRLEPGWRYRRYGASGSAASPRRIEVRQRYAVSLQRRFFKKLSIEAGFVHVLNRSTRPLFDYRKNLVKGSATWAF